MAGKMSKKPKVAKKVSAKPRLDEAQLARWIRQAAALPGWAP